MTIAKVRLERKRDSWMCEHSLGDLAHFVVRSLARLHESYTYGHGISAGDWIFLHHLWCREGITQHELSRQLGVCDAATAAALRRIEEMSLICRRVNPRDRRETLTFLTNQARRLMDTILLPAAADIQSLAICDFSDEEVALLCSLLLRVVANMTELMGRSNRGPSCKQILS